MWLELGKDMVSMVSEGNGMGTDMVYNKTVCMERVSVQV